MHYVFISTVPWDVIKNCIPGGHAHAHFYLGNGSCYFKQVKWVILHFYSLCWFESISFVLQPFRTFSAPMRVLVIHKLSKKQSLNYISSKVCMDSYEFLKGDLTQIKLTFFGIFFYQSWATKIWVPVKLIHWLHCYNQSHKWPTEMNRRTRKHSLLWLLNSL